MKKKRRLIGIKNFDEELYRLVKAYASLEGRSIASVFEEAIRLWLETRSLDEAKIWSKLDREYESNMAAIMKAAAERPDELREGFALACGGKVVGVFKTFAEAARMAREVCKDEGVVAELPLRERKSVAEVELGFPW